MLRILLFKESEGGMELPFSRIYQELKANSRGFAAIGR